MQRKRDENGRFCHVQHDKFHKGYKVVYMPDHPHSRENGYVYEHILVAEKKIGRHLLPNEEVHHIDENKLNNNPSNLMIFPNHSAHTKYHWEHRNHKYKTSDGRMLSIDDIAKLGGTSYMTAYQRIKKLKWTVDETIAGHRGWKNDEQSLD